MSNFRPSLIAVMVSTALSASAAVNATQLSSLSVNAADFARAQQAIKKMNQQASANERTISGMSHQFDQKTNRKTFSWATAQQQRPEMIAVSPEKRNEFAANHYLKQLTGVAADSQRSVTAKLYNLHDTNRGGIIGRYQQRVNDIEVFNRAYNIMMDRNHNFVAGSGYFADVSPELALKSASKAKAEFKNPENAIQAAFADLGGDSKALNLKALNPKASQQKQDYQHFEVNSRGNDRQLVGEPRSKKVYFEHKGKLVPAFYVEVQVADVDSTDFDYYSYVVDAASQKVLFKNNLKAEHAFTYRVWADTAAPYRPWDGPHGNVNPAQSPDQVDTTEILTAPMVSLSQGPISTGDHWLHEDSTETIGNNVHAYVDAVAPDGLTTGDYTAEVTSFRTFDYVLDRSEPEYTMNNRKASIVNMFYMNNYLHDDFYDRGFDEMAGNAQSDNYERGGEGGDPLHAQSQDYSGFNNANMSTPADGASPRMQMFHWQQALPNAVGLSSHPDVEPFAAAQAAFGSQEFDITAEVVRIVDDTDPSGDGCEGTLNADALAGKIAFIDRGACAFVIKALNAQAAGAVGMIVANSRDGDAFFSMGGSDDSLTIGSVMISQNDGAALQALLDSGDTVAANIKGFSDIPLKDSSFDNAIVSHEWGHYISNRLVGNASGLSNNQGRSMGEGWGDFHALITVAAADEVSLPGNDLFQGVYGAITYVGSFYHGIRRFPYTTNMDINQHTFDNIMDDPQVHASGNVWSTMLWGAYVGLINDDRHSFEQARDLMKDYLVAGYKMTPNAPTYTEARDAILAAAYANDLQDYNTILAAFARRGMGLGAISPPRESTDHLGVVESYETTFNKFAPTSAALDTNYEGATTGFCSNDGILDKGETGTVAFNIANMGSETYSNVTGKIEVMSDHDVTFANGGVVSFGDLTVTGHAMSAPLEFTLNDSKTADTLQLKLTFPDFADVAGDMMVSTTVNYDFKDLPFSGSSATSDAETLAIENDFKEHVMVGGDNAKGAGGFSTDFGDLWRSLGVEMGDGSLFIRNLGFTSDIGYETKPFLVSLTGSFVVNWVHYYNFEQDFDGGVVEVSINGSQWFDVTQAGGTFLGPGYDGPLLSELEGRNTYTGEGAAFEAVDFGEALAGQMVRFRFRSVSDGGANNVGWVIDDLGFTNIKTGIFSEVIAGDTNACDNRLPIVTAGMAQVAGEGMSVSLSVMASDPRGDALTYEWQQTMGPAVELINGDTATPSFTSPMGVGDDNVLMFTVNVSDGTDTVSAHTMVTLNHKPMIDAQVEQSAIEGELARLVSTATDMDGDELHYSWTQTAGPAVTLTAQGSSITSYIAPTGDLQNNVLGFTVSVTDGINTAMQAIQVTVNRTPDITSVSDDSAVNEGASVSLSVAAIDLDNDEVSYSWMQTGGTTVELTGADSADASFTAPTLASGSEVLTFMVGASDGHTTEHKTVSVTVNDVPVVITPPVTPTTVKRSGGGSTGLIALLLLPLVFIRRRFSK